MIGHYLLTLTPEQEGRVLTRKMGRQPKYVDNIIRPTCGCLKGTVHNYDAVRAYNDLTGRYKGYHGGELWLLMDHVGVRFDDLCLRFGVKRTNAAIRNRILSNRANRVLRHAPQLEAV